MYFLKITRDRTVLPRSGSLLMISTKCKLIGFSKSWTTSASSILNFENEHLKKSNVPLQQSHYPSYLFYMDLFHGYYLDFHCFKVLEPLLNSWKIILTFLEKNYLFNSHVFLDINNHDLLVVPSCLILGGSGLLFPWATVCHYLICF